MAMRVPPDVAAKCLELAGEEPAPAAKRDRRRARAVAGGLPGGVDRFAVTLPLPPSANNLFVNVPGRGRVRAKAYRAWAKAAAALLAGAPAVRTPVRVVVTVLPGRGWRRGADVGNREKALTDALVTAGVLPGDSWEYVRTLVLTVGTGRQASGAAGVRIELTCEGA